MTAQHPMKYPWTSAPLKEGRGTSFGLGLHNRRRTAVLRLFILLLAVATIYWTITSSSKSSDLVEFQSEEPPNLHKPLPDRESTSDQAPLIDNEPTTQKAVSVKAPHTPDIPETPEDQHVPDIVPSEEDTIVKPQLIGTGEKSDPQLNAALAHVISLLPNEITTRELLRPVEGTGKEKLREMGLRVRAFKTYFEAWEALHFVSSGDDVHIRDDVIQYLRSQPDFTSSLTPSFAQTIRSYESYRYFLQRLSSLLFPWTAPYFANHMTLHTHFKNGGRGIVLSCGDDQAPYLLTSIQSFRRLGCTLPIEVMYLGDSDLSEDYRAEMELIPGVITRDISQMVADEGWQLKGWAVKPFAILLSSFREAIFIDADALFFKDPEVLFDDPLYAETGTLFFRDRIIMPESKKRWLKQILPNPISIKARQSRYWTGQSGHMQESGVVVVDKSRHFVALLMVTRMNGPDRDGNEEKGQVGVYDMVYGDKETYWLGWELVGDIEYAFHNGDAGVIGTLQTLAQIEERQRKDGHSTQDDSHNGTAGHGDKTAPQSFTICAPQLLHLDTENRPLWFNGWILNNKFAEKKQKVGGRFEVYLKEPTDSREPDPWQLQEHNEACLTADETYKFTQDELNTLDMIVALAKEKGAYGKD